MAFGRAQSNLRQKCIQITDLRVQKMNEVLTYVKLIKMYAWELPFSKKISGELIFEDKTRYKILFNM